MTPAERRIMNNAIYAQQLGGKKAKENFVKNNGMTPTQYINSKKKK